MADLEHLDAVSLGGLIRRREVSPAEVLDATFARIDERNEAVNAVTELFYDQARHLKAPGLSPSPLAGVPFLMKDLVAEVAGTRLTGGSRLLDGYVSDHDSELVRRYRNAGLVIVGKTNVPEFGVLGTTESRLLGPCRNPWRLDRSVGGSSGGAAAAVAARMTPIAHASDGGGSIRIPASCCGVFGLKPTRARNPLGPDFGDLYGGLAVEHAVTLSVRDSAALLDISAGPDVGDPYPAPPTAETFADSLAADPGRLRIAVSDDPPGDVPVELDCREAVRDAAALCEVLGHEVTEAAPEVDAELLAVHFDVVWKASIAATVDGWLARLGRELAEDDLEPLTRTLYSLGARITAPQYIAAITGLQRLTRRVARFFERYDVLLTPTLTIAPPRLGWLDPPGEDPLAAYERDSRMCAFLPVANMTGQPAMSVPTYWSRQGLPIGTHFSAGAGEEATLLRLAAQIETARPWIHRRSGSITQNAHGSPE